MNDKINKTVKLLRAMAEVLVTFAGFIGALAMIKEAFSLQDNKEDGA